MFSRSRNHRRTSSNPAIDHEDDQDTLQTERGTVVPTSVPDGSPASSPLDVTFDFELPTNTPSAMPPSPLRQHHDARPAPNVGNFSRPRTSDGPGSGRKTQASLNPYILPPIPRVASRYEKDRTAAAEPAIEPRRASRAGNVFGDITNIADGRGTLQPRLSFEHPVDMLSLAPRAAFGARRAEDVEARDPEDSIPEMQSSLFPPRVDPAPLSAPISTPLSAPPVVDGPIMTRSFIDSRDKPYSHPAPTSLIRANNHSTPDLLARPPPADTPARPTTSRLKPRNSAQSLASKTTSAGLSGTTALASTPASMLSRTASSTPVITIGTPYSETSPSFPAPERVSKRPSGANATATVAGVSVPTHYSSSSSSKTEPRVTEGKKKTRLLNPMSVFQRRRTGQDGETAVEERSQRQAQAQALARQKDVVVGGVNKLPDDFDPSIKGKVVHDFSAPRVNRNTFGEMEPPVASQLQASFGTPSPPSDSFSTRSSSVPNNRSSRDDSSRMSARTPVFTEHLNEEADASGRISSIHAENLENKDFLQRASMHPASNFSQDPSILPPFARRSQILDPAQAAFAQDTDSRYSSIRPVEKEPDTVSPLVTPHEQAFNLHPRRSVSPVSLSTAGRPPGPASPGLATGFRQEVGHASDQPVASPRSVSGDLVPPKNDHLAGSPSLVAVSPIEPLTPTKPSSHQGSSQPSPLQLTPPDHEQESQPPVTSTFPTNTMSTPGKNLILDPNAGFPTPDRTPDPAEHAARTARPPSQAKIAEKRTSAGARSKRAFSGPRHHASTASRFSFQYASGESAAEEHALEDKHRKLVKRGQISANVARGPSPDEEEEDYFDEDAMDDMDEMEMQGEDFEDQFSMPSMPVLPSHAPSSQPLPSMQQARQMLQPHDSDDSDEDEGLAVTDERSLPYPDHSAYRNHSAIITPHTSLRPGTPDGYWRGSTIDHYMRDSVVPQRPRNASGASALTINTNVGPFSNATMPRPTSSNSNASASRRDERSRVVSGMSFSSASDVTRSPPPRGTSGIPFFRPGAAGSPSPFPQINSGSTDSSHPTSGLASAPSTGSSSTNNTTLGNRRSSERHSKHASPALSNRSYGVDLAAPDGKNPPAVSPVPPVADLRPAAGLGLNMLADRDHGDSPTIPLHYTALRASVGKYKSGLGTSTVPADVQDAIQWTGQAAPSPPATAELRGTEGFDVSGRRSIGNTSNHSGLPNLTAPTKETDRGLPPIQTTVPAVKGSPALRSSNLSPGGSSAVYQGSVGRGLQVRSPHMSSHGPPQQTQPPSTEYGDDDLYYDDGNFQDEDVGAIPGELIDENVFDYETFPSGGTNHRRDNSALTVSSTGSDGPYPSFAMPNAAVARARDSEMMLEDLPLQDPVDPKLIPRRNPSEDAKRLGLSKKAPPPPVAPSNVEAYSHMRANLQYYHAALADAANRAAADGRFMRVASTSTARSLSGISSTYADEDKSHYSRDTHGDQVNTRDDDMLSPTANGVGRSTSNQTTSTQFTQQSYSPTKMTFDFGFDQAAPADDGLDLDDEDLVAAANADVLASDDEGFYGQEFRFYGRPRSDSDEVEATHGGYFGEDGDDGLARNRSLKEPNLTPITERSEFSTRNSFIGVLPTQPFGPNSPALARVPVSPWTESDITSFDQLRKLRANAFAGSSTSLNSSNRSSAHSIPGFTVGSNPSGYAAPSSATRPPFLAHSSSSSMGGGGTLPHTGYLPSPESDPSPPFPPFVNTSSGRGSSSSSSGGVGMHPVGSASSHPLFESPLSVAMAHESSPSPFSPLTTQPFASPPPSSPDPADSSLLATPRRPPPSSHRGGGSHARSGSSGEVPIWDRDAAQGYGHGYPQTQPATPPTAKRISGNRAARDGNLGGGGAVVDSPTHSRKGSGDGNNNNNNAATPGPSADSVTYVREPDPTGGEEQRWVLERRRTSSQGRLELVGRELVQGGWI